MEPAFHAPRRRCVYRERSATVSELMKSLSKAMAEFAPITKDCEGVVLRNGRPVKYRYASMQSICKSTHPALLKQGVVPTQEYSISDEGVTLITTLSCGDEFISSTLPIRQFEDQQRLKAHMSYMRRAAYEGLLCLSAEDDDDGAEQEQQQQAPAASTNGDAIWKQNEVNAIRKLREAQTPAQVKSIMGKVRIKIDTGEMSPHCLGQVEPVAEQRLKELVERDAKREPAGVAK